MHSVHKTYKTYTYIHTLSNAYTFVQHIQIHIHLFSDHTVTYTYIQTQTIQTNTYEHTQQHAIQTMHPIHTDKQPLTNTYTYIQCIQNIQSHTYTYKDLQLHAVQAILTIRAIHIIHTAHTTHST